MRLPPIALEQIAQLAPACWRIQIPGDYADQNGHMNIRWYMAIFDDAGEVMHDWLGLTPALHKRLGSGTMDLEHHINYVGEVLPGEDVAIYIRFLGWTPKRLHYLMFMVNESRGRLAATFECMNAFTDLRVRKMSAFPPEVAVKIEARVAGHAALEWAAPVCGAMKP
jgi:acyl-CoA thioester hydrolase